jgi:hypothetical protein
MKIHTVSFLILLSPILRTELKEEEIESNVEGIVVKHTYRDEIKFLEVASPAKDAPDVSVNTTYEFIADDLLLYEYKTSKSGGSF